MKKHLKSNVDAEAKKLAIETHKELLQLKEDIERNYLAYAERLERVVTKGLYTHMGFKTFEEYIEADRKDGGIGWSARKGWDFVKIYRTWIGQAKMSPEKVLKMTWTKAAEVASVVTKENAEKWLEKATKERVEDLRKDVKKERARRSGKTVAELEKEEEKFELKIVLAKVQFENVQSALHIAAKIAGSDKQSYLIDQICLAYNFQKLSPDALKNLIPLLEGAERVYGVRIMAWRDDKVIFGKEPVIAGEAHAAK